VGDGDQGPRIILEIAFQPLHALRIEMIGRFVEKHDVRPGKEDHGQEDPHLPPPGELPAVPVIIRIPEPEPLEDLAGPGLEGVAVPGVEKGQGRLVILQQPPVGCGRLVFFRTFRFSRRSGGGAGEAAYRRGYLPFAIPEGFFQGGDAAPVPEIIHQGDVGQLLEILGKIGQGPVPAVGDLDGPAVQFHSAQDGPEQGGFSRAVVAHQADPAPFRDMPGKVGKDCFVPEGQGYIFQIDQFLVTPGRPRLIYLLRRRSRHYRPFYNDCAALTSLESRQFRIDTRLGLV